MYLQWLGTLDRNRAVDNTADWWVTQATGETHQSRWLVNSKPWNFLAGGGGEGIGNAFLYFLRGPSLPHSPTHSTVQYISNHPSPCALQPTKYHTCSVKKDLFKNPEWKCMILFTIMVFIYKDVMGMGKKPKENEKRKKKKAPLVALPSPLLRYGGRLFSGAQKKNLAGPTLSWKGFLIKWDKRKKQG